jgi:hypothetical protein
LLRLLEGRTAPPIDTLVRMEVEAPKDVAELLDIHKKHAMEDFEGSGPHSEPRGEKDAGAMSVGDEDGDEDDDDPGQGSDDSASAAQPQSKKAKGESASAPPPDKKIRAECPHCTADGQLVFCEISLIFDGVPTLRDAEDQVRCLQLHRIEDGTRGACYQSQPDRAVCARAARPNQFLPNEFWIFGSLLYFFFLIS